MKQFVFLSCFILSSACTATIENNTTDSGLDRNYPIVHMIFLNLKDDLMENDRVNFINSIEQLAEINVVHNLNYGNFKDLRDPRALDEYELVIQMQFASHADYLSYQKDERHLKLKQMGGLLLAGPPSTYHFTND